MAVTVITKKRGRPLVTGEVGVSIINWKDKYRGGVKRFHQTGSAAGKENIPETWWEWVCPKRENKQTTKTTVNLWGKLYWFPVLHITHYFCQFRTTHPRTHTPTVERWSTFIERQEMRIWWDLNWRHFCMWLYGATCPPGRPREEPLSVSVITFWMILLCGLTLHQECSYWICMFSHS